MTQDDDEERQNIRQPLDGDDITLNVPAAHAERIRELLRKALAQEEEPEQTPEHRAAEAVRDVDSRRPAAALARTMTAHAELTGDREAPLNAIGLYMLSNGTMLADLMLLLRWLKQQGHLDQEIAERLGFREDALENLDRTLDEIGSIGGLGELAWELQIRALSERLQQQMETLPEPEQASEHRARLLLELAAGRARSLDEARQHLAGEDDEGTSV